ncbi:MAG: hypothetical protein JSS68_14980 [Actinobacteria bacterium]|nr:hypothetical protein [Actinomycetota bacterium]
MALGTNIARLGIPHVNQNPQSKLKVAIGNRVAVKPPTEPNGLQRPKGFNQAWSTFKQTPTYSIPAQTQAQNSGSTSAQSAATATTTPTQSGLTAATTPTSPFQIPKFEGPNDPRDATYWENLSKLIASDQTKYGVLTQEQTNADAAFKLGAEQAAQNRQGQERKLGLSTLTTGLIDSGYHDRTDAEQAKTYTNERSAAELTKSQEDLARAATRQALVEGYGTEAAALLGEAAVRYGEGRESEAEKSPPEATSSGAKSGGSKGGSKSSTSGKSSGSKSTTNNGGTTYNPKGVNAVYNNKPVTPVKAALGKSKKAR